MAERLFEDRTITKAVSRVVDAIASAGTLRAARASANRGLTQHD